MNNNNTEPVQPEYQSAKQNKPIPKLVTNQNMPPKHQSALDMNEDASSPNKLNIIKPAGLGVPSGQLVN
jgi:hypothetical protein